MNKTQSYDIHASFLVPVYNLSQDTNSIYITTQNGVTPNGAIAIDVWLVNAKKDQPKKSMIESLEKEEKMFKEELQKTLEHEKPTNIHEKSDKLRHLEHGTKVFEQLVRESKEPVYQKTPDDEFLKIARRQFSSSNFSKYHLDLNNYLYLAGLSRYEEK